MAMASEVSGESFLIATGVDTSVNQIVDILLKLTNSPLKPRHVTEAGKVQTTTKASLGFSPAKAKQMLGWDAEVGIEDGIRRLIAWAEGSNRP
jgi:UDP-glucose 4-epimerase